MSWLIALLGILPPSVRNKIVSYIYSLRPGLSLPQYNNLIGYPMAIPKVEETEDVGDWNHKLKMMLIKKLIGGLIPARIKEFLLNVLSKLGPITKAVNDDIQSIIKIVELGEPIPDVLPKYDLETLRFALANKRAFFVSTRIDKAQVDKFINTLKIYAPALRVIILKDGVAIIKPSTIAELAVRSYLKPYDLALLKEMNDDELITCLEKIKFGWNTFAPLINLENPYIRIALQWVLAPRRSEPIEEDWFEGRIEMSGQPLRDTLRFIAKRFGSTKNETQIVEWLANKGFNNATQIMEGATQEVIDKPDTPKWLQLLIKTIARVKPVFNLVDLPTNVPAVFPFFENDDQVNVMDLWDLVPTMHKAGFTAMINTCFPWAALSYAEKLLISDEQFMNITSHEMIIAEAIDGLITKVAKSNWLVPEIRKRYALSKTGKVETTILEHGEFHPIVDAVLTEKEYGEIVETGGWLDKAKKLVSKAKGLADSPLGRTVLTVMPYGSLIKSGVDIASKATKSPIFKTASAMESAVTNKKKIKPDQKSDSEEQTISDDQSMSSDEATAEQTSTDTATEVDQENEKEKEIIKGGPGTRLSMSDYENLGM